MAELRRRIEELERSAAVKTAPMSVEEVSRWWVMFCVEKGTGQATGYMPGEYSPEEWAWFREHEQKALETLDILIRAKALENT